MRAIPVRSEKVAGSPISTRSVDVTEFHSEYGGSSHHAIRSKQGRPFAYRCQHAEIGSRIRLEYRGTQLVLDVLLLSA